MLNISNAKHIVILGGGTTGWFAALTLRRHFLPEVEIRVIESSAINIMDVDEGGLSNILEAIQRNNIDIEAFRQATDGTYKWGCSFEGWRTGTQEDKFFNFFWNDKAISIKNNQGFHPHLSSLISQRIPLEKGFKAYREGIAHNISQQEAHLYYYGGQSDIPMSLHFDSSKIANFLKKIALERGVQYTDAIVNGGNKDKKGHIVKLKTDKGEFPVDFLIDASGLSRVIIGRMGVEWESFKEYLPMDSAIPFYMKHPFENPTLYTRSIAMNAGWMWQIPLQGRVSAGYLFSSAHIDEESVKEEVREYLGYEVAFQKTIKFDTGCYKEVWRGNVMALGLSSGFVEPLEATSIGQMLEQLFSFEKILAHTRGVITQQTIDNFNSANYASWMEIRDFLVLHYDCPRRDNAFWQDVANLPKPESYSELKAVWQHRTPRFYDISGYAQHAWINLFSTANWTMVGSALGIIPPSATIAELQGLPPQTQRELAGFLVSLGKKFPVIQEKP